MAMFIPSVQSCFLRCISGAGLVCLERLSNKLMFCLSQGILFYGLKIIYIVKIILIYSTISVTFLLEIPLCIFIKTMQIVILE